MPYQQQIERRSVLIIYTSVLCFFEALLLVYDITNRKSYDNIKVGYNSINIHNDVVFKENGPKQVRYSPLQIKRNVRLDHFLIQLQLGKLKVCIKSGDLRSGSRVSRFYSRGSKDFGPVSMLLAVVFLHPNHAYTYMYMYIHVGCILCKFLTSQHKQVGLYYEQIKGFFLQNVVATILGCNKC